MDSMNQTLEEIEKAHEVIRVNAMDLSDRKKSLSKKVDDMSKVSKQLDSMSAIMEVMQQNGGVEIQETNVLAFIKPASLLQEKWIDIESKRAALEECLMQLKKAYEDKVVSLLEFLDSTRKLSATAFLCMYKKVHIEQLQRKQG